MRPSLAAVRQLYRPILRAGRKLKPTSTSPTAAAYCRSKVASCQPYLSFRVGSLRAGRRRVALVKAQATRVSVRNRIIAPPDTMAKDDEPGILPASEDAYGGVIIDKECLPSSSDLFEKSLAMSLKHWREYGFRGVWLKIPLAQAALVPAAVSLGFIYHHAEPDYLMLNHWLPESPSTLPPNASHQVGVGGFVLNEKHEVLVVQEMNGPLRGQGVWKMPTGLVSVGEDLHLAAVREVKEETGVDAQFEAVLATRQSHGMAFGKSDLFFVCALRATSDQTLRPCNTEISDARWIALDEFCDIEFMKGRELYAEILRSCKSWADGTYSGFRGAKLEAGIWASRQDLLLSGSDQ